MQASRCHVDWAAKVASNRQSRAGRAFAIARVASAAPSNDGTRLVASAVVLIYEKPTNWTLIGDGTGHRRQMNWMRAPEALDSAASTHFQDLAAFVFRMDSPLSASLWLL